MAPAPAAPPRVACAALGPPHSPPPDILAASLACFESSLDWEVVTTRARAHRCMHACTMACTCPGTERAHGSSTWVQLKGSTYRRWRGRKHLALALGATRCRCGNEVPCSTLFGTARRPCATRCRLRGFFGRRGTGRGQLLADPRDGALAEPVGADGLATRPELGRAHRARPPPGSVGLLCVAGEASWERAGHRPPVGGHAVSRCTTGMVMIRVPGPSGVWS